MAKSKGETKGKAGSQVKSASGATRPVTHRLPPGATAALRELSDRLDLRSMAGAIEMGTQQLLAALKRYDARPPLRPEQVGLTVSAIRAAGIEPRRLGPGVSYPAVLTAAVIAAEGPLVPAQCTAGEYAELLSAVKGLDWPASLWVIGRATGG